MTLNERVINFAVNTDGIAGASTMMLVVLGFTGAVDTGFVALGPAGDILVPLASTPALAG